MRQLAGTYTEAHLERIIEREFAHDSIPAVKALLSPMGKNLATGGAFNEAPLAFLGPALRRINR